MTAPTIKVSALPAADPLTGSELVMVVQGGESKAATANQLIPVPVASLQFDIAANDTPAEGEIVWNATDRTLDVGLGGGDVTLRVGQEVFMKVRAQGAITKGDLLMAVPDPSGQPGRITVAPADGSGAVDSMFIVGVAAEDIANNQVGFCQHFGPLPVSTTAIQPAGQTWARGDILRPHPTLAGKLTNSTATVDLPLAFVVTAGSNGVIFVRR
jgi:hypothetical protein